VFALATTRESFLARPRGRYLRGRSWIFCCASDRLYATFIAGRPEQDDLRELTRAYAVPGAARLPHHVLFDASRVVGSDIAAIGLLLDFFLERATFLTRNLTRVAAVHGAGLAGAMFAGYPQVLPLPCVSRRFKATEDALAWLDCDATLAGALCALADSLGTEEEHLVHLRALLCERPGLSAAEAARSLGIAPRSLQRRLQAGGTSFRRELDRARLAAAMERLVAGDSDLTAVAHAVGFSSQQSFSDWFRRCAGQAPGAWRQRYRRPA
jgi:AraC-like DNA-binding protein